MQIITQTIKGTENSLGDDSEELSKGTNTNLKDQWEIGDADYRYRQNNQ